jgi:hypothetical protein
MTHMEAAIGIGGRKYNTKWILFTLGVSFGYLLFIPFITDNRLPLVWKICFVHDNTIKYETENTRNH